MLTIKIRSYHGERFNIEQNCEAIETVLNELDRVKSLDIYKLVEDYETGQLISVDKIDETIEKLQEHKLDILESPVHNANEKLKMIKVNSIRIETLKSFKKELLNKE